jgi:hypothetical protein
MRTGRTGHSRKGIRRGGAALQSGQLVVTDWLTFVAATQPPADPVADRQVPEIS